MTTSRSFPFRVQVTPLGGQPYHTPYKSREEMQQGIETLVKNRTVGRIEPFMHNGETWVSDALTQSKMADTYSNHHTGQHKQHFKVAATLFSSLARVETLSDAQRAELYEIVEGAFNSAGIALPQAIAEPARYDESFTSSLT